jgi:tetratricopeptide (TPR) repeat protein
MRRLTARRHAGRRAGAGAVLALALLLSAAGVQAVPVATATATSSVHASFERGVKLYEQGEFEAAAEVFDEILATGVDDPVVHYNLANSCFKAGLLGRAIYHYRRAHALAPRDEDIAANLEYARFLALDAVEGEARTDLKVEGWLDRVTSEEVFRVAALFWVLAGVAGILWQLLPGRAVFWQRSFVLLLVIWALSFGLAGTVARRADRLDEAVVLAREAKVHNGPGDTFATAFVLHEGAEVVVEGERGDWTEISLPGELRGWISSESIAKL